MGSLRFLLLGASMCSAAQVCSARPWETAPKCSYCPHQRAASCFAMMKPPSPVFMKCSGERAQTPDNRFEHR
jgi:hypothetical protein